MYDLLSDVQNLIQIKSSDLQKIKLVSIFDIANCIAQAQRSGDESCQIDIGIGVIATVLGGDQITIGFTPSEELQNTIIESCTNQETDLEKLIKDSCSKKMIKIYKELV